MSPPATAEADRAARDGVAGQRCQNRHGTERPEARGSRGRRRRALSRAGFPTGPGQWPSPIVTAISASVRSPTWPRTRVRRIIHRRNCQAGGCSDRERHRRPSIPHSGAAIAMSGSATLRLTTSATEPLIRIAQTLCDVREHSPNGEQERRDEKNLSSGHCVPGSRIRRARE